MISFLGWTLTTDEWIVLGTILTLLVVIISIITLGFVIYDVRRPERRVKKLKSPAVLYFIVPSIHHHECNYAKQDGDEHKVKQIYLRPFSEYIIDIVVTPKVDFTTSQLILACEGIGENNLQHRPRITEVFNRFITVGPRRHVIPGNSKYDDYIDKYYSYHMVEEWQWTMGTDRALGFKLTTKNEGIFSLSLFFAGGEIVESNLRKDIMLNIANHRSKFLHCEKAEHQKLYCVNGIIATD